jgi:hypothetical protein
MQRAQAPQGCPARALSPGVQDAADAGPATTWLCHLELVTFYDD